MSERRGVRRVIGGPGPTAAAAVAALLALTTAGCWRGESTPAEDPSRLTIKLSSPAFTDGGMIPKEFTCDGPGGSPPLEWSGVPRSAKELALIVEDPDAPMGTFSHWVVVNLSPRVKGLEQGVPAEAAVPAASIVTEGDVTPTAAARQGKNDFGKIGYGGPCPPSGTHHYVFHLYALDVPIKLDTESPGRSDVLEAIEGHIVAEGRLVGQYARSK
jgi:Raf kinase inhibitor-like YbhB/YbcL family protein